MALYALDEEDFIFAADALPFRSYRCLECSSPVKVRRGKHRVPHFYHLQKSARCHLYSKSEDHLIVQLQLQKMLPQKEAQIEIPFWEIHRISDVLWEKEKIAFEIQCSPIEVDVAEQRIVDYAKLGIQVVWLLDDRVFNRKTLRKAEEFLRCQVCYFFTFHRQGFSHFYDQMEVVIEQKRLKRGGPICVDLSHPVVQPSIFCSMPLPACLEKRLAVSPCHFRGDLIYKIILNRVSFSLYLEKWRTWEIELHRNNRSPGVLIQFFNLWIARPYLQLLDWLIYKVNM